MKALGEGARGALIRQSEIDQINAKYRAIGLGMRKVFWSAIELGEWFIEAQKRLKFARGSGHTWNHWLDENFPHIASAAIGRYMRLAANRQFLEARIESKSPKILEESIPTIGEAIAMIQERDEHEGQRHKRRGDRIIEIESRKVTQNGATDQKAQRAIPVSPPPEVQVELKEKGIATEDKNDNPVVRLRDRLVSYVWRLHESKTLELEISELIRLAELDSRQVQIAIQWATREHPELEETLTQTFAT